MNKIRILFKKKNGNAQRSGESIGSEGQVSCEKICDRPDWPSCGSNSTMPELMEQIDHISGLIKNIYDGSPITSYDKKLQERLSKGRQELELLENECKFMSRNLNASHVQLRAVKEEKAKLVIQIPTLIEEDKKEIDLVLQRYDVFLHARWGVLKHSKNLKKLESFLLDIKKRYTNIVNMEKCVQNPQSKKSTVKIETPKAVPVVAEPPVPAAPVKPKPPAAAMSINPLAIKRIPRPYKRRRQQDAPISIRSPLMTNDNKGGIVLYPIEELERQQRLAAQIEKQNAQNFNSVVLPIEYVDLTQDLPMNAPVRTEPGPVNQGNRDSTTSLASNIHSEISCMMQALFGETASTTSINLENLNINLSHNANLFLNDDGGLSDNDLEDASSSNNR